MAQHVIPLQWYESPAFFDYAYQILVNESSIDPDKDIYLLTWNPDPSLIPDDTFENQHIWCSMLLTLYTKACYSSCFCLEDNQKGNPHYHGWYQRSELANENYARIMLIKKMQFYAPASAGLVITKCKGHYRINNYLKGQNALYYYKKDIFINYIYRYAVIDRSTPAFLERIPGPEEYELSIPKKDSNGLLTEYIEKYFK